MLKKLIRYDFMSTWKLATIALGASLGAAILSMICSLLAGNVEPTMAEEEANPIMILADMVLRMGSAYLAMLAFFAAGAVMLLVAVHYYKKFLSDEAYLTFTLPATPTQHLLSKMILGSVWGIISMLVVVIDVILIVSASVMSLWGEIISDIVSQGDSIQSEIALYAGEILTIFISVVIMCIVLLITQLGLIYLCLTIGGVITKKYKALAGIGVYWVGNSAVSGVMSFIAMILSFMLEGAVELNEFGSMLLMIWIWTAVAAGFGIAYFFLNKRLLTKNLNLP